MDTADELEIGESSSSLESATLSLIDTRTGQPIAGFNPLSNGAIITLSSLPTRDLSIRATPSGSAGSVRLALDSNGANTDSSAPYALCGDNGGVYNSCSGLSTIGSHSLSATVYSRSRARGSVLSTTQVSFSVRESATTPPPLPPPPPPTGTQSAGCGVTGKPTGDFFLTTTDGRGTTRSYEVMVPSSYNPSTPLAVTFVFHGAGGDENMAKGFGLQQATGAAAASIFVFPRGMPHQNWGVGWDDGCSGYDMVFFDRMLSYLQTNYCTDTKRVFAAGFSWGGDFTTALNCCRGDKLRGVAPASCADEYANRSDHTTYRNWPCPVTPTSAIRFTHQVGGDSGYPSPLFATTSALYRSFNGCSATSSATSPSPCVAFSGCRQPVVECAYPNIGHSLPGGWANDTWTFFRNLP